MATAAPGRRALVFGGTSGIGKGIALWLAGEQVSVTIVGRDEQRANQIIQEMKSRHGEGGEFAFLRTDAFSLKALAEACQKYSSSCRRLDFLVMSQGMATIQGYTPTDSGLDQKLVLHHFGRIACILSLQKLLEDSAASGADTRVLSVLSAGVHSPYKDFEIDPLLRERYSIANAANYAGFAQDLCLDACSKEMSSVSFIHACPGFVRTNWGTELPMVLRWMIRGMQVFGKKDVKAGEQMCKALLSDSFKGGFSLMSPEGQRAAETSMHTDKARDFMWNSTKEAILPHLNLATKE